MNLRTKMRPYSMHWWLSLQWLDLVLHGSWQKMLASKDKNVILFLNTSYLFKKFPSIRKLWNQCQYSRICAFILFVCSKMTNLHNSYFLQKYCRREQRRGKRISQILFNWKDQRHQDQEGTLLATVLLRSCMWSCIFYHQHCPAERQFREFPCRRSLS